MRITALASAFCVAGLASLGGVSSASAQALACGQSYTIKAGDTLQRLTNRAFGPGKSYNLMYRPNAAVIGKNPSAIEVGMVLQIPCLNGATANNAAAASTASTTAARPRNTTQVAAPAPTAAAIATPASLSSNGIGGALSSRIRIVTGSDWAPFQNQDQEQGGMITEIMATALQNELGGDGYKIDFINDYSAHLNVLIADLAYDLSFAWFRPNCDVIEKLGEDSQFRCNSLAWSDPVFEQIIGYYVRKDDPNQPQTHSDLFGRTVCRPKGYATFMMEEVDLVAPRIGLVRPAATETCFEMLLNGEADAVVLASTVADDALARIGGGSLVSEVPELATIATLHAVTSINNPRQDAQLEVINRGVRGLRENGKWFEIVQRHLIAHARNTASN